MRTLDVVVGRLQQLQDDVFDILADITGLGQRRRIGHGEGNVDDAGERLGKIGLAAAGRADEHDVRLRQLDFAVLGGVRQALVMVVNGNRQDLLRLPLADNVFVEDLDDVLGRWNAVAGLDHRGLVFLTDDVHAQFDAFIADEDGRSGNQFPDFVLALSAERTIKSVLGVAAVAAADLAHITFLPARRISRRNRGPLYQLLAALRFRSLCREGLQGYEPGPTNHVLVPAATNSPSNAECYVIKIQHSINSYY